jgi:hypothetical protein
MEDLAKIEAIKRLKARYFRLLDTKQWDAWGEVFTEDAVLRVEINVTTYGGEPDIRSAYDGRAAIRDGVRGLIHNTLTVHHGHMPEIELTSPTTAKGIWAMEDILETRTSYMRGYGHYHETYRLVGDDWQIASLRLSRLRVEITQRSASPD